MGSGSASFTRVLILSIPLGSSIGSSLRTRELLGVWLAVASVVSPRAKNMHGWLVVLNAKIDRELAHSRLVRARADKAHDRVRTLEAELKRAERFEAIALEVYENGLKCPTCKKG
jgi:hypothetical protein